MQLPHCQVPTLMSGIVLTVITAGCVEKRLYRQKWIPVATQTETVAKQTAVAIGQIEQAAQHTEDATVRVKAAPTRTTRQRSEQLPDSPHDQWAYEWSNHGTDTARQQF